MKTSNLSQLQIDPALKRRPRGTVKAIFAVVAAAVIVAIYFAFHRPANESRSASLEPSSKASTESGAHATTSTPAAQGAGVAEPKPAAANTPADTLLTVSGYIVNRERIEISPRFQGVVRVLNVKKGDAVKKDQIVVLLDDAEQRARVAETEGRLASARVALDRAELNYRRVRELRERDVISKEADDEARLSVDAAKAAITEIDGQRALAETYLQWTIIRSPIDGVVLEKLAEPGELVTPQSFGGTRGPSTAVLAVADLKDLQVEIDVSEADLAKISLGQRCRVTTEAYPDKHYEGIVAEISPEANRQKGTLQIKVQIKEPDRFLTPELSAKVDFLPL